MHYARKIIFRIAMSNANYYHYSGSTLQLMH